MFTGHRLDRSEHVGSGTYYGGSSLGGAANTPQLMTVILTVLPAG